MLESLRNEIHAALPNRATWEQMQKYGRFSNAYDGQRQDHRLSYEPLGVGRKSGTLVRLLAFHKASRGHAWISLSIAS